MRNILQCIGGKVRGRTVPTWGNTYEWVPASLPMLATKVKERHDEIFFIVQVGQKLECPRSYSWILHQTSSYIYHSDHQSTPDTTELHLGSILKSTWSSAITWPSVHIYIYIKRLLSLATNLLFEIFLHLQASTGRLRCLPRSWSSHLNGWHREKRHLAWSSSAFTWSILRACMRSVQVALSWWEFWETGECCRCRMSISTLLKRTTWSRSWYPGRCAQ